MKKSPFVFAFYLPSHTATRLRAYGTASGRCSRNSPDTRHTPSTRDTPIAILQVEDEEHRTVHDTTTNTPLPTDPAAKCLGLAHSREHARRVHTGLSAYVQRRHLAPLHTRSSSHAHTAHATCTTHASGHGPRSVSYRCPYRCPCSSPLSHSKRGHFRILQERRPRRDAPRPPSSPSPLAPRAAPLAQNPHRDSNDDGAGDGPGRVQRAARCAAP